MFAAMDNTTRRGFRLARAITRQHAKSFYFASLFLPGAKRYALYSVYSICRLSDDTVDRSQNPTSADVDRLRRHIDAVYSPALIDDPILVALRHTVTTHRIPRALFDELIEGVETDLYRNRYADFQELYSYCYKVAGVVGLMMLRILGVDENRAGPYAVRMGIAMQLTNILRDIGEDARLGRIYLPQDELSRFGLSGEPGDLGPGNATFQNLMKFQIGRAREYYHAAAAGIPHIPDGWGRFLVCLMKNLYAEILDEIERRGYDVVARRAFVSLPRKFYIALRTIIEREYVTPSDPAPVSPLTNQVRHNP